jgi:hypothetical protein
VATGGRFSPGGVVTGLAIPLMEGLQIGDMIILNLGSIGMTPDQRAAGIVRSRRLAIACMAAALACFMATLYFWDNAYRELDVSSLKPATTEPEK